MFVSLFRSSHQRCSVKKVLPKACNFIIKETLVQVFSCEFYEIFKDTFLHNTWDNCFYLFVFVCILLLRPLLFPVRRGWKWALIFECKVDQFDFTVWMPFLPSKLRKKISRNTEALSANI